jgi:hypothetical protein
MPCYCLENGCRKQASFNFSNEEKLAYCAVHKKDGMKDLKKKVYWKREESMEMNII